MDLPLEEEQIDVQSLVPESCRNAESAEAFLKLLEEADDEFEKRRKDAETKGQVLRYIGRIEPARTAVALQAVGPDHPFFALSGTDNIIAFTTERYREQPLVVKGAGAGTEVTAAGILADLLRVSSYL
jgi:aspartokinase/homoserine dehydrogenase 1